MQKGKKGITLIALIITIIIMLILVGVTVNIAIQGGLFNITKEAVEKTELELLKEEANTVLAKRAIDDIIETKGDLKEDLENGISGNKTVEKVANLADVCYVTRNNQTITVYDDGSIEDGKVDIWDGRSKSIPEVDNEKNWHIYTVAELKYFEDFVNGNLTEREKGNLEITEDTVVYLENNLDVGARQKEGKLIQGTEWIPIGKTKTTKFIGIFEGNNHIIRGIFEDRSEDLSGLFGFAPNTIRDLTIKNSYIIGGNVTGGIVGVVGTVDNCHNVETSVVLREGQYFSVGGIAGQVNVDILNCTNSGLIKSIGDSSQAGGIVGKLQQRAFNCKNFGNVEGQTGTIGGITSRPSANSSVSYCSNYGSVTRTKLCRWNMWYD